MMYRPSKLVKDAFHRYVLGEKYSTQLQDAREYFKLYGAIEFEQVHDTNTGEMIAVSKNFKRGTIVTSGMNQADLDEHIHDAILTMFDIPAIYSDKLKIARADRASVSRYAIAR